MTKLSMSEEEMLKRKYTRPYEKRIAELEDKLANADYQLEGRDLEIKELEAQIERNKIDLAISEHDREHNDYELTEVYKKIEQLEKENAELKETLKTYNGCGDWDNDFHTCRVYLQHEELQMYIEQLTKAKEIIREFMKYEINEYDGSLEIHFEELKKQAEQFLSEMEK